MLLARPRWASDATRRYLAWVPSAAAADAARCIRKTSSAGLGGEAFLWSPLLQLAVGWREWSGKARRLSKRGMARVSPVLILPAF